MTKKVSSQRVTNLQTRDVNAAQRVALALKLRSTRLTYEQIARQAGYANASACRKAVMRELERTVSAGVEELRREELDSLDRLEVECWRIFMDKERSKGQLFAVDRILAIKKRRADLMGLDMPIEQAAGPQVVIREVPAGWLQPPAMVEATP